MSLSSLTLGQPTQSIRLRLLISSYLPPSRRIATSLIAQTLLQKTIKSSTKLLYVTRASISIQSVYLVALSYISLGCLQIIVYYIPPRGFSSLRQVRGLVYNNFLPLISLTLGTYISLTPSQKRYLQRIIIGSLGI